MRCGAIHQGQELIAGRLSRVARIFKPWKRIPLVECIRIICDPSPQKKTVSFSCPAAFTRMQELDDFATLVTRHVNKVYSVALRHTRNSHQAEEITQTVFVTLAKKARHLGKRVVLSGWLYQTTRLTSASFLRTEIRRARREQEAHIQTVLNETEPEVWPQSAPLLDTAIARLNETDRDAVVLRFFDGRRMSEVGAALGASEDAAKKYRRSVSRFR